jgi:hypothetical protein
VCGGIDGGCSNITECGIKNTKGNCRSGCEHTGNEISSSCIYDECGGYDLSICQNNSECIVFNQFCMSDAESNRCFNQHSIESCGSTKDCFWKNLTIE